jgi:hypothetical protein
MNIIVFIIMIMNVLQTHNPTFRTLSILVLIAFVWGVGIIHNYHPRYEGIPAYAAALYNISFWVGILTLFIRIIL